MNIPYGRHYIENDDIQAVIDTLKSDYLTTGPKIAEFEEMVAKYVGAKYALACSNGTTALHLACLAAGIGKGDEVITTPITFVATSNAVLYCGGSPVFADIHPQTYNIDPEDVRRKITKKTKAIIAVHFAGQPCDMDQLQEIAHEYNLILIEDGAHALGATYRDKKVGSISSMTTFSFHPVKHITTGEGGMVTTNSKELYDKLVLYRSHGITRDLDMMTQYDGPWYYQQLDLGYNYRMTDIQCALGISQMKKLDRFIQRRKELVNRYNEAFDSCKNIICPKEELHSGSSWHLYVIQVLNKDRRRVFDELRARGIGVNVHYIPVYTQPYYRKHGYEGTSCPRAEMMYERFISLPLFYGLTNEEQEYVIGQVKELVE